MRDETPAAAAALNAPPNVHNGTYTVDHPERGHFTVKLFTVKKGPLVGKRILSLLTGPNNTTDFKGVAFWGDAERLVMIWTRYRGPQSSGRLSGYEWSDRFSAVEQKAAIWADLVNRGTFDGDNEYQRGTSFWAQEGYTLLRSGRCCVCNLKLTAPDSIQLGIGPKCGGRS